MRGISNWEKTQHVGAHREALSAATRESDEVTSRAA
jgi:hypothetical protein